MRIANNAGRLALVQNDEMIELLLRDLIFTGTSRGVGAGRDPKRCLAGIR